MQTVSDRPKAITREGSIFDNVACYVLNDGRRVITKRSMVSALSGSENGKDADLGRYVEHLPNGSELLAGTENVTFVIPGHGIAHGTQAETVTAILGLYADALAEGKLRENQKPVAYRALKMLRQLATTGIVALIDEATGYQKHRKPTELHDRLMSMIRTELDDIDPVYKPLLVALARLPGTTKCNYCGEGVPPAWAPLVANICVTCTWGEEGRLKLRELNPKPTWTHRDTQHLDAEGKKVLNRVIGIGMGFAHIAKGFEHWRNQMESYFKGIPLQGWLF